MTDFTIHLDIIIIKYFPQASQSNAQSQQHCLSSPRCDSRTFGLSRESVEKEEVKLSACDAIANVAICKQSAVTTVENIHKLGC